MSRITIAEFEEVLRRGAPFAAALGVEIVELGRERCVFRLPYRADFLRPGGTISGPMMMGLADLAMYGAVLAAVGKQELAVTTNLNINFLRKPGPAALVAEAKLLKLGKRLAIGEVAIFSEGDPAMVAHVTATYSLPPEGARDS
ncbi:MAG TPA: PaaI family thioesterase [Stellaceae bacterium]|nr:PaaI family thioesterase [Stellaceae bacterium]